MPETNSEVVESIEAIVLALDPATVTDEVDVMTGARVQAWAASGAVAKSSSQALPLPDSVDRWVHRRYREFGKWLREARRLLELAKVAQDELTVRLTLEEAQALAEEESDLGTVRCANCDAPIQRSRGKRVYAGRCAACYQYRRRHQAERPKELWSVEREEAA